MDNHKIYIQDTAKYLTARNAVNNIIYLQAIPFG